MYKRQTWVWHEYQDQGIPFTEEEADAVERGADLPERMRGMVITVSPLVVDGLRTFFLLKPVELHNEIKQLRGSRVPRAVSLFIQWLLTLDKSTWQVREDNLIDKLRLSDLYHRQRQKARVDKQIQKALETAQKLAYLLAYQVEPSGLITLTLNPEKCGARTRPTTTSAPSSARAARPSSKAS